MLSLADVESVLQEYVDRHVPAMLQHQYHLILVKGGPEYPHLSEQSHFTHIVNGVFGFTQFVRFLLTCNVRVPWLDEGVFRKAIALYTVHEVHKDREVEMLGTSSFSIPLDRLREEYERLGLDNFAEVDDHLLRAANVHKRSTKHGDLLLSGDPHGARLWLLVRIADTLASVKTPEEAIVSLQRYLADLGPAFAPKSPPGRYALYYHQLQDVRGVLTNAVHEAVASRLGSSLNLYPLLFFATGTLYVGPQDLGVVNREGLVQDVADVVLRLLVEQGKDSADAIRDAIRPSYYDFETYVYAFSSIVDLLNRVREDCVAVKKPNIADIEKDIRSLLRKGDLPKGWTEDNIWSRLGMQQDEPKAFLEHLARARRYLLYADKLIRALAPTEDAIEWFLGHFRLPANVLSAVREVGGLWAKGGPGKYVLPVAYHFLRGPDFADRPAEAYPPEEVLDRLHRQILLAVEQLDTQTGRQAAVAELGLRHDLESYLFECLHLSFAPNNLLTTDGLADYVASRRKGHRGKLCSLCNRSSEYAQQLRTGILDDFGRVFSNRVLPDYEAPQTLRLWCPVCQLECIMRKLTGMGLPGRAHYKNSRRIYLYVLPTYSFTPEHLRLFEPLLKSFHRVTGLPVRDYGKDWGLPHYWLAGRALDPDWLDRLQDVLIREAEKIDAWGGRSFVGERISLGRIQGQPHYYLITWEKAARETESDDARVATRTEAWAKALFAAAVITGLTSCKLYVTERPYLPVSDPAELKATITLDGPPPALRGLLGKRTDVVSLYGREQGPRSGLERVLDVSAAMWTVTSNLRPGKDKHVSGRLERLNIDPLAGAFFYKEYGREHDGQSPYSPFDVACEVLLEIQGGELMDLVERIARKSLEMALPRGTTGRGKARRYELVFREAVSAMRKAQKMIPELRAAALGGDAPPEQSVAELKRLTAGTLLKGLERRQESRRGDIFVHAWGKELGRLVGEFVDILVDDLYLGRAGGSFARFLRLENALADGIYYYTDRNLSTAWSSYKEQRASHQEEPQEGNEEE
ncbi:MAG: type I-D CRISPR-associated protein Cas10d/Csc3 [Anaerolineae bacterium]|nr:type I-D CRISPR-associated protein Cas10d/Csc3 [Anaerolineae bacterium]